MDVVLSFPGLDWLWFLLWLAGMFLVSSTITGFGQAMGLDLGQWLIKRKRIRTINEERSKRGLPPFLIDSTGRVTRSSSPTTTGSDSDQAGPSGT